MVFPSTVGCMGRRVFGKCLQKTAYPTWQSKVSCQWGKYIYQPMTDPWDERYILPMHDWLILYGKLVGKYTVRPTDPNGQSMAIQSKLNPICHSKDLNVVTLLFDDFCGFWRHPQINLGNTCSCRSGRCLMFVL